MICVFVAEFWSSVRMSNDAQSFALAGQFFCLNILNYQKHVGVSSCKSLGKEPTIFLSNLSECGMTRRVTFKSFPPEQRIQLTSSISPFRASFLIIPTNGQVKLLMEKQT